LKKNKIESIINNKNVKTMNIEITHTITLAPEVLTLLQAFLGKAQQTHAPVAKGSTPSPKAEEKGVAKIEEPKVKAETPAPAATKETNITLEQVRDVVQKKALAGKRVEVKTILTSFGAENVTGLEKEKYADFLEKVNEL
jgi:hypothetical protein